MAITPAKLTLKLFGSVRGRMAREAEFRWNMAKSLMQASAMWAFFFFIAPAAIHSIERARGLKTYRTPSRRWKAAAVAMFASGGALSLTSAVYMAAYGRGTPLPADCPRELVVAGPYRYVRNPMALGSLVQGVAVGIFLGSPLVVAYTLIGMTGWNYVVRPWEEMDLEQRFGAPYHHYRDSVRCWIPSLRPYAS